MSEGLGTADTQAPGAPGFTVSEGVGLLNILAGLMLVCALLFYFGGLVAYLTRLGLDGRTQGLGYMNWGVGVLFVLVILLGIIRFIQFHQGAVLTLVAVLVVLFGAWAVVKSVQESKSAEKEEEEK